MDIMYKIRIEIIIFIIVFLFADSIFCKTMLSSNNKINNITIEELKKRNYYEKFVKREVRLHGNEKTDEYANKNNNEFITIGCVSKSIFGASVLLFSQDLKNEYLFKGKDLEITIGELLENRKVYLESLDNLTEIQRNKLNFINNLLNYISDDIYNSKVYQVLNHTSIFADDFNEYLIYSIFQKFVNDFPEEKRNELILKGIQVLSIYYKNRNRVIDKYSNMGFMYMAAIMNLMTDEKDFYTEVENRIFVPLNLQKKFFAGHILTKNELKEKFKNRNYGMKFRNTYFKFNIYDFNYSEMDTLNGGLITNLESVLAVGEEIAKMYFGIDNKLTHNPEKTSELFFKYKTYRKTDDEFYSLGTMIVLLNTNISLKMRGNLFGYLTALYFSLDEIGDYSYSKIEDFEYKRSNYNTNVINKEIFLEIKDMYLYNIFFSSTYKYFSLYFNDILLKSIIDEFGLKDGYINTDLINNGLNYDKENTINKLHLRFINNTNELIKDSRIKEIILENSDKYFQKL